MNMSSTPGGVVEGRLSSCAPGSIRSRRPYAAPISILAAASWLAIAGCDSSSTSVQLDLGPQSLVDASITVVQGDAQEGSVGRTLEQALVVQVTDPDGRPIEDAPVEWVFLQGRGMPRSGGGGAFDTLVVNTDPLGRASIDWELGRVAGVQQASAGIPAGDVASADTEAQPAAAPKGGDNGNGKKVGFQARARPGDAYQISISPSEVTLAEGDSTHLDADVKDSFGNLLEGTSLSWSTTDENVAVADDSGMVWAVGSGTTEVNVDAGKVTASVAFTAMAPEIVSITVSPDSVILGSIGDTATLHASAHNSVGDDVGGITFDYISIDPAIVQVDSMGRLTAQGVGAALVAVSALCCDLSDSVVVTVNGEPDTLTITIVDRNSVVVSDLQVEVGDTAVFEVLASNTVDMPLGFVDASWSSANTSVATVSTEGLVTAVAEGSSLVTASYATTTETLAASVNVIVTNPSGPLPPPPPPPATGYWFEEDWDYASTAELLSDPNGWLFRYPNADITLETDPTAPWPSQKAFVVHMTPSAGAGGFDISFPESSNDRPREIWQETYIKFSANWVTDFGGTGNPDHKTILWFDQRETGSTRWSYKFGVFGHAIQAYVVGHFPTLTNVPNLPSEVWNGQWHRLRVHFKMGTEGNADGIIEAWVDNRKIAEDFAVNGPNLNSDYFNKTALGRNLNQVPTQNQEVHFGRTRVWTTSPGW